MTGCPPCQVVLFDCDSTLSAVEGIDELARRAGVGEAVADLTRAAMEGRTPLETVYARRLEAICPDRRAVEWLGRRYVERMEPTAAAVVRTLQAAGKDVHIVSGGIRQAVLVLAGRLGVPPDRVHAVDLYFDERGGYASFDTASPLTRGGGKAEVCRGIIPPGAQGALVGDGVTDLEAAAAGVCVIGFGGLAAREVTRRRADVYIPGPTLDAVLPVLLGRRCGDLNS